MGQMCAGHKKDGSPCGQWARRGGTVCNSHGGRARQVQAKAKERLLAAKAAEELARLDVDPIGDPLTLLADLLGQAVAFKDVLAVRVNELQDRLRFVDDKGTEQLRSEVALWERALDRCERFAVNIARLNIDDRLAQISERQLDMVAGALQTVLAELGLSEELQLEAHRGLARHLRQRAS